MRLPIVNAILRFARTLKFGQLFLVVFALVILDILIPDHYSYLDEVILGVLAIILANLKKRDYSIDSEDDESETKGRIIDGEVTRKTWDKK